MQKIHFSGLEPERIIGAYAKDNEILMMVKWKGHEEADIVPSRIAKEKCPHLVVEFFERISYCTNTRQAFGKIS